MFENGITNEIVGSTMIQSPQDIMKVVLMHPLKPKGHIKIRLKPNVNDETTENQVILVEAGTHLSLKDNMDFHLIVIGCKDCVPHNGLTWLPPQGEDYENGIYLAKISHLFFEDSENFGKFVNVIGPLITEMKVLPPD